MGGPTWNFGGGLTYPCHGTVSTVACCHGAKLCAHAARDFRSQQNDAVTRMWRSCRFQPSHKERAIGVVRCKKEGMLFATSPVVLRWLCDSQRTGCAWRIKPLYMKREQAIVREIASMISIVACCHGAKLCAHAARDFRSQQNHVFFSKCFSKHSVTTRWWSFFLFWVTQTFLS